MAVVHLISPATIKEESWVQQNVDSAIIASIIPDIELMKLEPIIGVTLYNELLDQVTSKGGVTIEAVNSYRDSNIYNSTSDAIL